LILKGISRYLLRACLLLGLLALAQACGISSIAYLEPPYISVSNSQISVRNNSGNYFPSEGSSQTFKGIEIYYRVFEERTVAETAFISLNSYASQYQNYPDNFMSNAINDGFTRMRRASDRNRPLISIAANNTGLYTISLTSWDLSDDANNVLFSVVRDIPADSSRLAFQERNFQADDVDYQGETWIGGGPFFIICFAVSFGEDSSGSSIGAPIYSLPSFAQNSWIIEY